MLSILKTIFTLSTVFIITAFTAPLSEEMIAVLNSYQGNDEVEKLLGDLDPTKSSIWSQNHEPALDAAIVKKWITDCLQYKSYLYDVMKLRNEVNEVIERDVYKDDITTMMQMQANFRDVDDFIPSFIIENAYRSVLSDLRSILFNLRSTTELQGTEFDSQINAIHSIFKILDYKLNSVEKQLSIECDSYRCNLSLIRQIVNQRNELCDNIRRIFDIARFITFKIRARVFSQEYILSKFDANIMRKIVLYLYGEYTSRHAYPASIQALNDTLKQAQSSASRLRMKMLNDNSLKMMGMII